MTMFFGDQSPARLKLGLFFELARKCIEPTVANPLVLGFVPVLHGDQDPTKATTSLINRTATFSGVCVTRGGGSPPFTKGVGYFLLPELQPHPGLSMTTSPLLSGQVLLESGP